jgi:hypothetical protein
LFAFSALEKEMLFKIFGPFEIPRTDKGLIETDAEEKKTFWQEVDESVTELSEACGCYVFAINPPGGGARPWYIGLASKQSFRSECFQPHKINLYNNAIAEYDRGSPQLYLIAKLTSAKNCSRPSTNGHGDVEALEDVLIGIAYARNQYLLNMRGTAFLRDAVIPGIMNTPPGNPGYAAAELKKLLGL